MKPIIPKSLQQTVNIKRYTAGTRATSTTIASSVTMLIEPLSYFAQIEKQRLGIDADFQATVTTPVSSVRNNDVVVDASSVEYAIVDVKRLGDIQEFMLKKRSVL